MKFESPRRKARQTTLNLLYEIEFGGDEEEVLKRLKVLPGRDAKDLARDLICGVIAHREHLDGLLSQQIKGWELEGIGKVELTILRMGLYEILFRDDIPAKVSIDEAVELAKRYAGPKAAALVNGVLDNLARKAVRLDSPNRKGSDEQ